MPHVDGSWKQTDGQSHLLPTMIGTVCTSVKSGRAVRTNSVLHAPQIAAASVRGHVDASASAAVEWQNIQSAR